ncbi:c-type cytochrome [Ilyomonas limi]|uniref:C-type cytochrome n=1 Tax=Ilyomonas limi TaxID=2575867 RepID=A0A4U3L311_9BACT|nr:c-type cytochrome [Ilyomonas limi]TKK68669.1 c-type cytochrome [Ilyomonas limi]
MKKFIVIIVVTSGLFVASCGNQNGDENNQVNDTTQANNQSGSLPPAEDSLVNAVPSGQAYDSTGSVTGRGASLIAGNDCKTCHNTEGKNIGPSYQMIADKYGNSEAMADELSLKIIKGGSGRWGTVVMPPHNNVSTAEARDMARYILSLSKNNGGTNDSTASGK